MFALRHPTPSGGLQNPPASSFRMVGSSWSLYRISASKQDVCGSFRPFPAESLKTLLGGGFGPFSRSVYFRLSLTRYRLLIFRFLLRRPQQNDGLLRRGEDPAVHKMGTDGLFQVVLRRAVGGLWEEGRL